MNSKDIYFSEAINILFLLKTICFEKIYFIALKKP
jgi:hypothetical protein